MAECIKNYFDALPDKIILMILGNLEELTARSNLAQVSHRFNRLANCKNWRKNIFISSEEFKRFSSSESARVSYMVALMKEIALSNRLESICIKFPVEEEIPALMLEFTTAKNRKKSGIKLHAGSFSGNNPSPSDELCTLIDNEFGKLSNIAGVWKFRSSIHISHLMVFFSPICEDANIGHTIRYHSFNTTYIEFVGKQTIELEKILEFSKEFIREVKLECPINMSLLIKLSECKKLENVILTGELILPSNANETNLPQITSEVICLVTPRCLHLTNRFLTIFLSDELRKLTVPFSYLRGLENEICSRCPNLKSLKVSMKKEINKRLSYEIFSESCSKLIPLLKSHLHRLEFTPAHPHMKMMLQSSHIVNLSQITVMERLRQPFTYLIYLGPGQWTSPLKILLPHKQNFYNYDSQH